MQSIGCSEMVDPILLPNNFDNFCWNEVKVLQLV